MNKEDIKFIIEQLGCRNIYLKDLQKDNLQRQNLNRVLELQEQIDKVDKVIEKLVNGDLK